MMLTIANTAVASALAPSPRPALIGQSDQAKLTEDPHDVWGQNDFKRHDKLLERIWEISQPCNQI